MKLQEELQDSGFVIIASHAQNVPKDQVVSYLRSSKVNFSVTSFGRVPEDNGTGIPRAFLFDATGKLVEDGHPMELKSKVKELMDASPHFLAAGREYKALQKYADALKKTKSYGAIVKALKSETRKGGDAEEEANYLSERILGHGNKLLEKAKKLETEDAYAANFELAELSKSWKGCEVGDAATDRLKELKKDKDFQTELKASAIASQILAECDKLIPVAGKINLDYPPNKKIVAKVQAMVPVLKKKYADTQAASRISEQLASYGIQDA